MYVPVMPGLSPGDWFRSAPAKDLPFPLNAPHRTTAYVARNLIYHLFRALRFRKGETVLVPDYHHGNEVRAMRVAGANIRFYPIQRNLQPDLDAVERLSRSGARALVVIHYLGWPQPLKELSSLCRTHGMVLVEDCALSMLSEMSGEPLGAFGDYAVFCPYKTLPIPNGGLLVQNRNVLDSLTTIAWEPCGIASVASQVAESMLMRIQGRWERIGAALRLLKRATGQSLSAMHVERLSMGNHGFDLAHVNLGMSPFSRRLLKRFDYDGIRRRRQENYRLLYEMLEGRAKPLPKELEAGVCPLFFPLLAKDKTSARRALAERGVESVEFWNAGDPEASGKGHADAQFLRKHVLELPIHQDLTPEQIDYMAKQVISLWL